MTSEPDEFVVEETTEDSDADEDMVDEIEDGEERYLSSVASAGKNIGTAVTGSILLFFKAVGKLLFSVLVGITRPLPGLKTKFWHGMAQGSIRQYHKAAGGDRLGLEATPGGTIELTPVKYRSINECDDDEKPGWTAKGREKTWKPTTYGEAGPRIGKTPVVPLDAESWRATNILEARIAEAVDQGETRPLYNVEEAQLTARIDAEDDVAQLIEQLEAVSDRFNGGSNGKTAQTDGGYNVSEVEFDPRSSPIFEDMIIDLGSDDYDGQAVSWRKAKELMLERTTTEEMNNQEERGYLAGQSRNKIMRYAWKMFLIASLVAITGLIGKEMVGVVFGGGGGGSGGGGGLIPFTATFGNLLGL